MYSTVIRQQHRIEQERLLLSFIAQKYYKAKGSNIQRHNAHPVRRMMRLKQHGVTQCCFKRIAPLWVRIVKKSSEGRDIDKYCIKSVH